MKNRPESKTESAAVEQSCRFGRITEVSVSVITISRRAYSRGREVAEKVAARLGYRCIAHEVVASAAKEFNIEEKALESAIEEAPPISNLFVYGREKFVAYVQKALLHHLQQDKVVYHGFAGHLFVQAVPHVLKVRIVASLENRIRNLREQQGISRKEAVQLIKNLDEQRKKWSKQFFGVYPWDPRLYDLVVNIKPNGVADAVDFICHTIALEDFRSTAASQHAMDDLVLAADVKAALIDLKPDIEVSATGGTIHVTTTVPEAKEKELIQTIEATAGAIKGVRQIKIHTQPSVPYGD